jgi:hypothetical protein
MAGSLVGGRHRPRLYRPHFLIAADDDAAARLGAEHLGIADLAAISTAQFVCHSLVLPYFLISIGWPWHVMVPVPARVTINSEPHFEQIYLLPAWLAISYPAFLKEIDSNSVL